MRPPRAAILLLLALGLAPPPGNAATLALQREFVKRQMNRATIQVTLHVFHTQSPHPIGSSGNDGDVHFAGRSDDVGLPFVAEIMNARSFQDVLDTLKQTPSSAAIEVRGVWRVWFEHPGDDQVQGEPVPEPDDSNPDHVFEIHPITSFEGRDLRGSLVPIAFEEKKYEPHPAAKAFAEYEKKKAWLWATDTAVHIESKRVVFNYTEFFLQPVGEVERRQDASFVLAKVFDPSDLETPLTAEPHRMVFVRGSEPERVRQTLQPGELLHVLGEPRVNLREVLEFAEEAGEEPVEVPLPYEMVIIGLYPEEE